MKSIKQNYELKTEVKKSVFIAHLCPFECFKELLLELKKEHNKAVHFVWAFRRLNEFSQIIEDKSDDGEPKGTSGLPCLNVLRGAELINVAVIVVRYFGGIKLGTGGLVRAYSGAVNAVINTASLSEFECKQDLALSLPLSLFARMQHYLITNGLDFDKEFKAQKAFVKVWVNEDEKKALIDFAQKLGISP